MSNEMTLELPELYPTQKEFCEADGEEIGFGGAVGGGKSHVARVKMILLAYQYPGIQILLVRRTLAELRGNHVLPLISTLRSQHPIKSLRFAEYKDAKKEFIFPNASRIELGYCETDNDVLRYQGQSFDVIFLEEATLFSEFIYQFLSSRNRLSGFIKKAFKPRMYFTGNPGGIGHQWFKKKFIDDPLVNTVGYKVKFIKSRVYDNKFLMENDPNYVKKLESLPPKQRAAFLDGDWDSFEGQFFEEFDRDKHVIDPFPIPDTWRIYRTRDYGFDKLACYWVAVDHHNNAYVFREVYESNLIVSNAAMLLNERNMEDIYLDIAPRDLWNRNQDTGRSAADIFRDYGQYLTKASMNRELGWLAIREWLADVVETRVDDKGQEYKLNPHPKLRIFKTCKNLIRTLPLLIYDDKNPNDCKQEPHEITHGPDSLRYFCVSWTFAPDYIEQPKKENYFDKVIRETYEKNRGISMEGYIEW
jgi:phage terminase large subunit